MQLQSSSLPSASCYAEVLGIYNSVEGKRFSTPPAYERTDERPLGYHRKGYLGIAKTAQGDIDLRYHQTIVVKWRPDNTCRVDLSYESLSTKTFAEQFLPAGVEIGLDFKGNWKHSGAIVGLASGEVEREYGDGYKWKHRTYEWRRVPSLFHLKLTDERLEIAQGVSVPKVLVEAEPIPFETTKLNRKRANAALAATNYAAFAEWLAPWYAAIGSAVRKPHIVAARDMRDAMRLLADPEEGWPLLRTMIKRGWTDVRLMRELRDAIYATSDVCDTTTHSTAPSRETAMKWMRS